MERDHEKEIRVVVGCYCTTAAGEEGTMTSLNG